MAAFMVWVGAAACAKNVWGNTGFPSMKLWQTLP